jgi:hypothetical protein
VVATALSWIVGLGGGLLVLSLLIPRGTPDDEDSIRFSGEQRLFMLKAAGVLLAFVILMRSVGIDEDTPAGRMALGPVGFPILFLLFAAAVGGLDTD